MGAEGEEQKGERRRKMCKKCAGCVLNGFMFIGRDGNKVTRSLSQLQQAGIVPVSEASSQTDESIHTKASQQRSERHACTCTCHADGNHHP
jgi:hypothetical protein